MTHGFALEIAGAMPMGTQPSMKKSTADNRQMKAYISCTVQPKKYTT